MNFLTAARFGGCVTRSEVTYKGHKCEVFYLKLSFENESGLASDSVELDRFLFCDEPKNGPALVYVRELGQTESRSALSPNSYSSVMGRAIEPAPGPHGRAYLGEELLTSYAPDYVEMVWGFSDEIWDGPRNEWFAARALVEKDAVVAEVIVLVNEATYQTARAAVEGDLEVRQLRVVSDIEIERTFLIRPGIGTPPIYYVKPARTS